MAEYKKLMSIKQYMDTLNMITTELNTGYDNKYPKNLGYWDGKEFRFDCWNLSKVVLWGWEPIRTIGYFQKQRPETTLGDWTGSKMLSCCSDVSTNFSNLFEGASLLTPDGGHWGIALGKDIKINNVIVNTIECIPDSAGWLHGVQYTYTAPDGKRFWYKGGPQGVDVPGSIGSRWGKFGRMPWIDYQEEKILTFSIPKDTTQVILNMEG